MKHLNTCEVILLKSCNIQEHSGQPGRYKRSHENYWQRGGKKGQKLGKRCFWTPHCKTIFLSLLFLFYFDLDSVCTKMHRFVEYTPKTCFNCSVQSAVATRIQNDKNANCGDVDDRIKLLASTSYGYQITDHCRDNITKHLNDKTTDAAINI